MKSWRPMLFKAQILLGVILLLIIPLVLTSCGGSSTINLDSGIGTVPDTQGSGSTGESIVERDGETYEIWKIPIDEELPPGAIEITEEEANELLREESSEEEPAGN